MICSVSGLVQGLCKMDPLQVAVVESEDGMEVHAPTGVRGDANEVELLPIQGFLGVEGEPGAKARTQMKAIWDFFAEGSQGTGDALFKIKQTESKMAAPRLGETRLTKLYNYVRLQSQQKIIEAEMATL